MACWLLVSFLTQTTFDVLCQGQVYRGKKLHQLAVVEPAKECDLRIKDVVVGELSMYMPVYCSSHCKASSVMGYTSVLLLVLSPPGWYGNLGTRFSGVVAETPVKENGHR